MAKTPYEVVKEWRLKNKDKVREQGKRYRAKHPETRARATKKYRLLHRDELLPKEAQLARERRKRDPEGQRRRNLMYQERKRAEQERLAGRPRPHICEICGEYQDGRRQRNIVWDHDHLTGRFRGWICDRCNKTLVKFVESIKLSPSAAERIKARANQVLNAGRKKG